MGSNRQLPEFDDQALACLKAGKAVAIVERARRLDGVHLVEAALRTRTEEASEVLGVRVECVRENLLGGVRPPEIESMRLRVSDGLLARFQRLARAGVRVVFAELLGALVDPPCMRVQQLLQTVDPAVARPRLVVRRLEPYRTAQEHLADLHRLWCLRVAVDVEAREESIELVREGRRPNADSRWSAVFALQDKIAQRAAGGARTLPICAGSPLGNDILGGLVVNEVHGLGRRGALRLDVRTLARLLRPGNGWVRQLDAVGEAVRELERAGLAERCDGAPLPRPTDRVELTDSIVADVLEVLRDDPFTREETQRFGNELRALPTA